MADTATATNLRDAANAVRYRDAGAVNGGELAARLERSARLEPATTALIEAALAWERADIDNYELGDAVRAYRACLSEGL